MGKCKKCGKPFDDNILAKHKQLNPQYGLQCDYCENMIYDPINYELQQMFPGSRIHTQEDLPDIIRQHTFKGRKQNLSQSGCMLLLMMLSALSLIIVFISLS